MYIQAFPTNYYKYLFIPMEDTKQISVSGTKNRYALKKMQGVPTENGMRCESLFWGISDADMTYEKQLCAVTNGMEKPDIDDPLQTIMCAQIKKKILGYRSQDQLHRTYDKQGFISYAQIVGLLTESCLLCVYCTHPVAVAYRNVRYDYQWTLDRVDNSMGHNAGNVVMACLKCNLERRNIGKDAFANTKKMTLVKMPTEDF